jgi:hypothetical protein
MKRLLLSVAGLMFLGSLNVHAAAAQTNLVQSLRFNFSVHVQGAPVTNQNIVTYSITPQKISTADIIQAIATSISKTFSANATLLAVTPLSGAPGAVVIQDGTNRVDVTVFFIISKDNTAVANGAFNTTTGAEHGMECVNRSFRLKNQGGVTIYFTVGGLSQTKYNSLLNAQGAVIGVAEEYSMSVVGTAQVNGQDAIVRGTVLNIGRAVEITP